MKVFVIGAGPAGSLAAIVLARAGAAVTLFEQHRFPRDKVCGECVSALGRSVLQRHHLEKPLLDAGAIQLTRTTLLAGEEVATLPLPKPMLGVTRHCMDSHLLACAVAAGAAIRQPARVERITGEHDGAFAAVRDLTN
ncbi:MAG TPA: FAD-dependent monooxygenase, partial [Tepidisphaeraceae bacterium]